MLDYYERLLVAIAGSVTLGAAVGVLPVVEFYHGVAAGSLVATVFLYEALFRNPPIPPSDGRIVAGAACWHLFVLVVLFLAV